MKMQLTFWEEFSDSKQADSFYKHCRPIVSNARGAEPAILLLGELGVLVHPYNPNDRR